LLEPISTHWFQWCESESCTRHTLAATHDKTQLCNDFNHDQLP
jgi:hypothetical protein